MSRPWRAATSWHPSQTIGQAYSRERNSFTLVRLVLAVLVLYAHCYAITGSPIRDQLYRVTGGDMTFGRFAVLGFFVLSGFLVAQSLDVSAGRGRILRYFRNRALRVWPALVVATLLLAFVVGAALTKRPLQQYYSFEGGWSPYWYSFDTLTYNLASNAFGWHTRVRDVFAGNPMNAVMNGSLWSLRFEIALYVVLGGIALCVRYRIRRVAFLGLAVTAALYLLFQTFGWIPLSHGFWVLGNYDLLISVALYFFLGVATYAYRDWIPFSPTSALILALVAILASVTSFDSIIAPVAITYFIACIGASPFASGFDRRFGDYSYGTYIYAWPVQQAAVTIFSIASPYVLLAVALPATLGVAFVSWHLIEAPALRLKRRIGPIPTRSHIPVPAASK